MQHLEHARASVAHGRGGGTVKAIRKSKRESKAKKALFAKGFSPANRRERKGLAPAGNGWVEGAGGARWEARRLGVECLRSSWTANHQSGVT